VIVVWYSCCKSRLAKPVVQRAGEILQQLESTSGRAVKISPTIPHQLALFPETKPLLDELRGIDLNSITPIEALTWLYDWKRRFLSGGRESTGG
jgi:DNA mismatch repair protein MutS